MHKLILLIAFVSLVACQPIIIPETATPAAEMAAPEEETPIVTETEISGNLLVDGLFFPEKPYWVEADSTLYFVDFVIDQVLMWHDDQSDVVLETGADTGPLGVVQDDDGNFWVALYFARVVQYSPDGQELQSIDNFAGTPFGGPNDLVFDSAGGLYITDSGTFDDWASGDPNGGVYYLDNDGTLHQVDDQLSYPNGIALSPDETTLIVGEHRQNRLVSYMVNEDGTWSEKTVFYTLDDDCRVAADECFGIGPDGIITDSAGNYWVAHNSAGKIIVLSPSGELLRILRTADTNAPSNLSFGTTEEILYFTDGEHGRVYRVNLLTQ